MGLFPMVSGLPVRFTSTVDKKRKLFKFTSGKIKGWTLHPDDEKLVAESTEPEIILQKQPLAIYVKRDGEGMPQHESLEPEVFGLKPRGVDWPLDPPRNENWIKRYGFPLVPDFAATVHAVTGGQLTTCIGDMDAYDVTPSEEDAVKGYIIMSRVEYADKIALAQPFSPALFRQGALRNANLLLDVLRGKVKKEDLESNWEEIENERRLKKKRLVDLTWECGMCLKALPWMSFA